MNTVWTVEYKSCLRVEHPCGFRFSPKKAEDVARLILVLRGKVLMTLEKKRFPLSMGEAFFVPAGVLSRAEYMGEENETLVFRFSPISGPIPSIPTAFCKNDPALKIASQFAEEIKSDPNPNGNYALSRFYRILSCFTGQISVSKNKKRLLPALDHIERNFTKQEKVQAWAKLTFMSETAFRKLFREEMGISPIDYRNRLRLKFAEEMRREGVSAAAAAESAGFGSLSFYLRLRRKEKIEENL